MMRVASALLIGFVLTACSDQSATNNVLNVDENLTTTDVNATALPSPAVPPLKLPNYRDKEGSIYEYVSAVSEDDRKKGKAVGDVFMYAFRGHANGLYRLSSVDDQGHTQTDF